MCEYIVYICMALRVYMYSEFIWLYLAYIFYICMALLCTYILHLHCFSTERGGHLRYEYIYSCQTSTLSSQCHKLYLSHAFNGSFSYIYVYIYIFMRIYTFSKSIYTFMWNINSMIATSWTLSTCIEFVIESQTLSISRTLSSGFLELCHFIARTLSIDVHEFRDNVTNSISIARTLSSYFYQICHFIAQTPTVTCIQQFIEKIKLSYNVTNSIYQRT